MKLKYLCILTLLLSVADISAQTLKQWRDSLNVINKQISAQPGNMGLLLQKAAVNLQLAEWEDAAEVCNIILRQDTASLPALYYRAYANNNMRRYNLAKNDYSDFLKLSPGNMQARLGLAYTYTQLKDNKKAMDEMNLLVEMFPDSSIVYATRADLEKEIKLYDAALYDINEAISRDPGNKDLIVSRAEILILAGRKKEAKAALDDAVRSGMPKGALKEWYAKCK